MKSQGVRRPEVVHPFVHLSIHPFIQPPAVSFIYSSIHPFFHSLIQQIFMENLYAGTVLDIENMGLIKTNTAPAYWALLLVQ